LRTPLSKDLIPDNPNLQQILFCLLLLNTNPIPNYLYIQTIRKITDQNHKVLMKNA